MITRRKYWRTNKDTADQLQRLREQSPFTVYLSKPSPSKCDDNYGSEHPVEKNNPIRERLFLAAMAVVALVICIVCFGMGSV